MYLFAFMCLETDNGSGMLCCLFGNIFLQIAIDYRSFICERLVEFNNKVVFKVGRNTTAVFSGITDNLVLRRDYFHKRTFIKGVYHYIRVVVFGESETESSRSLCRSNFGHYIMIGKIYFIIIRSGSFSFVGKPTGTLLFIEFRFAYYRHNRELSVIINPRTGLMCLFKSTNLISRISVLPSVSHLSCLWSPEIHPPRTGNGRISITCW